MEDHTTMMGSDGVNPTPGATIAAASSSRMQGPTFRRLQGPGLRANQTAIDTMDEKDGSEDDREYTDAYGSAVNDRFPRYTESEMQAVPHSIAEADLVSITTRLPEDAKDGIAGGQTRRSKKLPEKYEDKVYKCSFTMDNIISLARDRELDVAEHNSQYRAVRFVGKRFQPYALTVYVESGTVMVEAEVAQLGHVYCVFLRVSLDELLHMMQNVTTYLGVQQADLKDLNEIAGKSKKIEPEIVVHFRYYGNRVGIYCKKSDNPERFEGLREITWDQYSVHVSILGTSAILLSNDGQVVSYNLSKFHVGDQTARRILERYQRRLWKFAALGTHGRFVYKLHDGYTMASGSHGFKQALASGELEWASFGKSYDSWIIIRKDRTLKYNLLPDMLQKAIENTARLNELVWVSLSPYQEQDFFAVWTNGRVLQSGLPSKLVQEMRNNQLNIRQCCFLSSQSVYYVSVDEELLTEYMKEAKERLVPMGDEKDDDMGFVDDAGHDEEEVCADGAVMET